MSQTRLTTSPSPPPTGAAPQHVVVHRPTPSPWTVASRPSSTLSRNMDPRSSPAEPMSTPPPLNVDGRRCQAKATASPTTHHYGEPLPSSSCPVRHPIDAHSCAAGVGAPPRPSHRRSPPHHAQ
jgi:hypothetical protein